MNDFDTAWAKVEAVIESTFDAIDRLRRRNELLEKVREAAASLVSEPDIRPQIFCYNMGVELIHRLAACDSEKAEWAGTHQ